MADSPDICYPCALSSSEIESIGSRPDLTSGGL